MPPKPAEKRRLLPEDLKVAINVAKVPRLFDPQGGSHPRGAFEGDEQQEDVQELLQADVDLGLSGMECITPFQRLHSKLQDTLEQAKLHPLWQEGKHPTQQLVQQIVPPANVPKFQDEEEAVYGRDPDLPPRLSCLSKEARARNVQGHAKRERSSMAHPIHTQAGVKVEEGEEVSDHLPSNEVVLTVPIYHPTKHTRTEEFKVLGSQRLLDLRRAVYCVTDCKMSERCRKSACFIIRDTFYSDTSAEDCTDYADIIRNWAPTTPGVVNSTAHFPIKTMQDTSFNDLTVVLGDKYLYLHAGGCAHFVMVTAVRLLHPQRDRQHRSAYPDRCFLAKPRFRKCSVCAVRHAKQVTYNDMLCPESPTFFCDPCFLRLHYSRPEKGPDGAMQQHALYTQYQVYQYWHE